MIVVDSKHYPIVYTLKDPAWDTLRHVCPVAPGYPVHKDWTLTTVDLINAINRLKNSSDIEYHWLTWHTAYSLMILAKEHLCELVYYFASDEKPCFYNLTKTSTPYWSTKFIYGNHDNCCYPVFVLDTSLDGSDVSKGCLFARTMSNAEEAIRQCCMDKVWYEVKDVEKLEYNTAEEWEKEFQASKGEKWLSEQARIVVNDGTQPLPEDFDFIIE